MRQTEVIIIGAGQAGLAMSHCLGRRGIGHAVLERGRVAERWRSERWDALRLLTPNWMNGLPGWPYRGGEPDGFMTMPEVIAHLEGYARAFSAPVESGTAVQAVRRIADGYRIETSRGTWQSRAVVIATGQCDVPAVPALARMLPPAVHQLTSSRYRNPRSLPEGGVMVVGASASGIQIAAELRQAGRPVTLSVGRHTRLPRTYRGRDIMWWMDRIGALEERADSVGDLCAARSQPSLQLVGSPERRSIDLGVVREMGVRLVGRAVATDGPVMRFRDDLRETSEAAQRRLERLLARIDASDEAAGAIPEGRAWQPLDPGCSPTSLDLEAEGIRTVVWATGYARDYGWLKVPVLDAAGEILHQGGVTPSPGLYVIGLRFLRRRNSNFLGGVGADAEELAEEILGHLAHQGRAAA